MERGWCSLGTALVQPRYTPILPINRISKFSIAEPAGAAENHVTQEWKTQRNCNTEPAGAAKNHAKTIFEYKKIKKVYFLLSLL
jgi:hypothetical protein